MTRKAVRSACLLLAALLVFLCAQPALAQTTSPDSRQPAVIKINSSSIQKEIPAEVIQAIDLRLGGGTYPGCLTTPEAPALNYATDNMDLTGVSLISTCGWEANEEVKITLMAPDGKFFSYQVRASASRNREDIYQVDVYFQPGVDAPAGKYRFTLQGSAQRERGGTIKVNVFFNPNDGARLYALPENRFEPVLQPLGGDERLLLDGFRPNEWVRLLIYTFNDTAIEFYAYQDVHADRSGRLLVEVSLPEIQADTPVNYYAYGQETHSVHMERFAQDSLRVSRMYPMDLYCPGALTPRLANAPSANAATGVQAMKIYQQPGFGSRVTRTVPVETSLRLYGYPKCIDHAFWWQVSTSDPILFGWVPESFLGKYQAEPAD